MSTTPTESFRVTFEWQEICGQLLRVVQVVVYSSDPDQIAAAERSARELYRDPGILAVCIADRAHCH